MKRNFLKIYCSKNRKVFSITLLITIIFIFSPAYGQWLRYDIDEDLKTAMGVNVADIDADGDSDVVATSENLNHVYWYENDNLTWQKHVIATNLGRVIFVYAVDIDGDLDLDLVANGFTPPKIVWYENNLPDTNWAIHDIDNTLNGCEYFVVADFDNDDDFDVAVQTFSAGEVFWYENDNLTWNRDTIDTGLELPRTVKAGYIDGDNSLDVVVSDQHANDLFWYKNNNNGTSWTKAPIDTNLSGSFGFFITDIDGDSASDVVVTAKGSGEVAWYKNDNLVWHKNKISDNLSDPHGLLVTDIDGDTDPDIVVTAPADDKVVWYKNNLPDTNWTEQLIDGTLDFPRICDSADFDDDTNPDLVVTGWNANKLVWYNNKPGVAHADSVQCFPNYITPQGDNLVINAYVYNPENHPVTVYAIIHGEQQAFTDSIPLYDDGQHNDSLASDNIWGNNKWLSGLAEDIYSIGVSTHDLVEDYIYDLPPTPSFTTIGPVVVDHDSIPYSIPFHDPDVGFSLKLHLRNKGFVATATNITAYISTNDTTNVTGIQNPSQYFGDIAPGQSIVSSGESVILTQNNPTNVDFFVNILSDGIEFWADSTNVLLTGLAEKETNIPVEFRLKQNYPNPFNPVTSIEYQLPKLAQVDLNIYNLLGQKVATLVSKKQMAGTYKVEWDAKELSSGLYYYRMETDKGFEQTKKLILLK